MICAFRIAVKCC